MLFCCLIIDNMFYLYTSRYTHTLWNNILRIRILTHINVSTSVDIIRKMFVSVLRSQLNGALARMLHINAHMRRFSHSLIILSLSNKFDIFTKFVDTTSSRFKFDGIIVLFHFTNNATHARVSITFRRNYADLCTYIHTLLTQVNNLLNNNM